MSRRGHRDGDGDWTPPRSRAVRPVTSGRQECGTCGHAMALHPGREACDECTCVWFSGTPLPRQAPKPQQSRAPRPASPLRASGSPPPTAPSQELRRSARTSRGEGLPGPSGRILGSLCARCQSPMSKGQTLRFDSVRVSFAHVQCLDAP